jgi:hypothetical protein
MWDWPKIPSLGGMLVFRGHEHLTFLAKTVARLVEYLKASLLRIRGHIRKNDLTGIVHEYTAVSTPSFQR